jgi:hypothetical protein
MPDERGDLQTERRIATVEQQVKDIRADVCEMKTDIRVIRDTLAQAKGGWKTVLLVAGAAGAVGTLLGKLLPFWAAKP